jgi:threonine dehydratase
MVQSIKDLAEISAVKKAKERLKGVAAMTPLSLNHNISAEFKANVYLKREDLQEVRSYKIRGAYNKMASMDPEVLKAGVVCASAGNHAQGVAFACQKLGVFGKIYMPAVTPQQKIKKVKLFGKNMIEVVLIGDTFDDAYAEAVKDAETHQKIFVHPFNDIKIIEGQGTVGLEILEQSEHPIDYVFVPVGGGGLVSGLGSVIKQLSPSTKIIGVEPEGAPAMYQSLKEGKIITLDHIDNFVDGAAVRRVGELNFKIAQQVIDEVVLVPEGKACSTILQLYNEEAMIVEPAGALTIAALDQFRAVIKGKNIVCVVSGSNNDITRTQEIRERSLLYEGLKHYFIIKFPQRAGALREFLNNVLGPDDDITHFEYTKKHNRESGPALVGIQVHQKEDYAGLLERMDNYKIDYQSLNDSKTLYDLLI